MSDNGNGPSQPPVGSSQTISSESEHPTRLSDAECVERCNELVEQYRRRENPKVDTILALRQTLLDSPTVQEGGSLPDALAVFVSMLDSVDRANSKAAERGTEHGHPALQHEVERRVSEPRGEEQEVENGAGRERDSSESSDEDERPSKRSKGRLDTSKFPWHGKRVNAIAALAPDDILSTPGCPPFPPEQWLNIVQWKVVDLAKVLEAAHSTDLEPKQTHVIDDKVELSFRAAKSSSGIQSAADHNIAFTSAGKSIQAGMPICQASSMPLKHPVISGSLSMTRQSAPWSHSSDTFASLIIPHLANSNTPSCPPLVWVPIPPNQALVEEGSQKGEVEEERSGNLVTSGIGAPALSLPLNVSSCTAVIGKDAVERTRNPTVLVSAKPAKDLNSEIAAAPRHRRKNVWNGRSHPQSPTALWTETAAPLPRPPAKEFQNSSALRTISNHPHLFRVSTCININEFESLLSDHPNPPFVQSVCTGLREEKEFVKSQIDKEVELGRYSEPFGPNLLPGMYSMPIHAVPKPGTSKFRLVMDHSAGQYSLNSMISRDDIAGVTLDNIEHLGNGLRHFRRTHLGGNLQLWKADISEAYRHMPMHPLWQVKQIVTFDGNRFVDRRNVFGGRASQRIYHAFMSLVIWIAIVKILIYYIYIYVDDSFSFQRKEEMELYAPYHKVLPRNLCKLLRLWDRLGVPHEERKQIFGEELPIIGFDVDPNLLRVRMSDESRLDLISSIQSFAIHGTRRSLRDFQRLAGHLNWALNVYPLLRPGLSALYAKTAGKLEQRALIWVNRDVVRELNWLERHLATSDGVYFIRSVSWDFHHMSQATLTVYTDASALAVTAAIVDAVGRMQPHGRLAVFTDNANTVAMFNTLAALPPYNWLLMLSMDVVLDGYIDLRVFHVPGVHNTVADHLSRWKNDEARLASPGLIISSFQPPRNALGAAKK
ncbi:DNA/RNA polymerase [Suillus brevipes Sb2]|nr:DNA/RNA polymerase [Suillus brevipes Sb2]